MIRVDTGVASLVNLLQQEHEMPVPVPTKRRTCVNYLSSGFY